MPLERPSAGERMNEAGRGSTRRISRTYRCCRHDGGDDDAATDGPPPPSPSSVL